MKSLKQILGFDTNFNYSTMIPNRIQQISYYKGKNFIWGLNERHKPPTLISPRPNIMLKKYDEDGAVIFLNQKYDDVINLCIEREKPEDIIDAIFNSKIFNYDLTKTK